MDTLIDILQWSKDYLKSKDILEYKLDAEILISKALGMKRLDLFLNYGKPLKKKEKDLIRSHLKKRAENRVPLQYILGEEEFYGYTFKVNESVLIPRSDTERLVELALESIKEKENPKVLDIGIGSGAIAITIAKERVDSLVLGVDISEQAIETANINKELNSAKNLKIIKSDVFTKVKYNEFDLIVSNPPYIPSKEYKELMPEVRNHEPKSALVADNDGYYFYFKIIEEAKLYLKDGGVLAFESGYNQAGRIKEYMEKNGYKNLKIEKDYNKIDRVVTGEK